MVKSSFSPALRDSPTPGVRSAIERYLATIPVSQRRILYKRYVERRKVPEIAAELDVPVADVEAILTRARELLRPA